MVDLLESLDLLSSAGLPVVKSFLARSSDEAVKQARVIGFPVVLKLVTEEAVHKTEFGGVIINLTDDNSVVKAYNSIISSAANKGLIVKGVIVQEQFSGLELIIGVKKDSVFGQVLMLGVGGVLVELFKDVSFRVCPVSKSEAKLMINELKAKQLLTGFRGSKPVNIELLAELVSEVSKLAVQNDIKEMDINPLIMKEDKALIVDARIIN